MEALKFRRKSDLLPQRVDIDASKVSLNWTSSKLTQQGKMISSETSKYFVELNSSFVDMEWLLWNPWGLPIPEKEAHD